MNADGTEQSRLLESDFADFMPRWSPDGRWIAFLSDRRGNIGLYVVPSDGGEPQPLLPEGFADAGNPTWSPDSRRLGFDAPVDSGYDIHAVDVETGDVSNLTRSPESEWYPVWGPRGDAIAAGVFTGTRESGTHGLVAIDVESGRHTTITEPTPRERHARDWWPSWSPDGARLVFASRRDGPWRLYTIGADGSGERRITGR